MSAAIKHPVPDRVKPYLYFLTSGHSVSMRQQWASKG